MPIITLTSDWGLKDHYRASVKGAILNFLPNANIIDISHLITPYNILEASYVIRNCYKSFPDDTIHIIGVNTEASPENPHIAIYADGQYFIGADNGCFSLILKDKTVEKIIEIEIAQDSNNFTFSARDVFAKAACHIASGRPIEKLGSVREKLNEQGMISPVVTSDKIIGSVIYFDNYGNCLTNISEELFNEVRKNRKFVIMSGKASSDIKKISMSYLDVKLYELLAVFNNNGYLEIALSKGNAAGMLGLGLKKDPSITILFE
ncbi:MAG: SAM-dependent chlorinase/fluorinase [Bacteroidota bacterium]|nr:SAM-dependent chlorinase/fluorinase [Bacteroidota bacterium]